MERREFLEAVGCIAGVGAVGGFIWGRNIYARSNLTNQLISDASPILVNKEHSEITEIPDAASEEMKLWFTGACLNSVQFIDYICTEGFASRLGQFNTKREREMCVANEFLARVVSQSTIYQRIEIVAKESGTVLDRRWKTCCEEVAETWKLKLNPNSNNFSGMLQTRLDKTISAELESVISLSANVADRPSIISTAKGIGRASIEIMPLTHLPRPYNLIVIPVFALIGITHFADYIVGLLLRNRNLHSAKVAISDRLALLGNRVATEFNTELKLRIADLHSWQNQALRKTAEEYAYENIGII